MRKILLSFDTEEFDLPKESGVDITLEEELNVSKEGINTILEILKAENVTATFFCTTTFATNALDIIKRIIKDGHEIASHGCDHTDPRGGIGISKHVLEELLKIPVTGYRQPRMFPVCNEKLRKEGYRYNSSLHPTFIPGRYMHLDVPRRPFMQDGILQIPVSVSPYLRLPVFWLACHNYPFCLYTFLVKWTLKHDGIFVVYYHPWEFIDLKRDPRWRIPWIIKRNSGKVMCERLQKLIREFKDMNAEFVTYNSFADEYKKG